MKKVFLYWLTVILFSLGCNHLKSADNSGEFKSVRVLMKVILSSKTLTNELLSDSTDIYFYKDFTIYKKPVGQLEINESNPGGKPSIGFYYLVKYKNDTVAYQIDSLQQESSTFKKVVLDSAYKEMLSTNFANIQEKIKSQYTLIDSIQLNAKDFKYSFKVIEKKDATYGDSIFYYYTSDSKLTEVSKFSLSNSIDKSNRGKLYKAAIFFNENPAGTNAFEKLGKQIQYELKNIEVLNKKEIINFIDHYKKPD